MKTKYVIETSAVRGIVGPDTANHGKAVLEATADGTIYTSSYIRMEFIRRWICVAIRFTVLVNDHGSLKEALVRAEQSFSPRDVKAYLAFIAEWIGTPEVTKSETVEELGRRIFHWIRRFDKELKSRVPNRSKCDRGESKLELTDFADILAALHGFHEAFTTDRLNCKVNQFLDLGNPNSEASKLINSISDEELENVKAIKKLANDVQTKGETIRCKKCETIGDYVICLEQSKSFVLVHLDASFNTLCRKRGTSNKQVESVIASDKKVT